MEQEKRMIDHWEVAQALHLGDREVALAVDEADKTSPYLVTNISTNNPFGVEQYTSSIGTDDYLEAMEEFTGRIQRQIAQLKTIRHEQEAQGVDLHPLGPDSCLSNPQDADFTGQVVVIRSEILRPEYRTPDIQLVLATHGNGCRPDAMGRAVYSKQLYNGELIRYDRSDILGVADPKKLPNWAVERLAALRQQEKERRTPPKGKKRMNQTGGKEHGR